MGDEHVVRILKMVEDGKISAKEAETLIAALRAGAPDAARPTTEKPRSEQSQSRQSETAEKSFEFRWGQRRSMPVDLGAIGKQISAAVRQIDPDKILKDAALGGKRLQEKIRVWARAFQDDDASRPVNPLGLPMARRTETVPIELMPDAFLEITNPAGSVTVLGGAETASVEVTREAWAATELEAEARLGDLTFGVTGPETATEDQSGAESPTKVTVNVSTPPDWSDGVVDLVVRVPSSIHATVSTTFGDARIENVSGRLDISTRGGKLSGGNLAGPVRAETVSGDIQMSDVSEGLVAVSKSGDIEVERMGQGGEVTTVSGAIRLIGVEGPAAQAHTVSGDVTIEHAGVQAPVDLSAETVSGDLTVVHSVGSLRIKTVSGDASAERLNVTRIECHTVSGDLTVSMDSVFTGTMEAGSVSGDVQICIPDGSSFRFDLATRSGSLSCDHPAADTEQSQKALRGTVAGGTGVVSVQTLSGDIGITRYP